MSLNVNNLISEIRTFSDSEYSGFTGYPETLESARTKWANAIQSYIENLVVSSPITVIPKNTSATMSNCGNAFKSQISFSLDNTEEDIANEFADAWQDMVNAIILVPGADYLGAGINPIISIVPFITASEKTSLKNNLTSIFSNKYNSSLTQITNICNALHSSILSVVSTTCSYIIPMSPPGIGPLVFG